MIRFALFALAFLVASSAQAQVHKCLDAAGKVTYTQDPCPANTKPESMSRRSTAAPAPAAAAPADAAAKGDSAKGDSAKGDAAKGDAAKGDAAKNAAPKTAAEQEQAFRKRQQDQAKAAKDADQKSADAKRKEENCRNARERLAQYQSGGRISRINAQGERYYLEDAQVEQEKGRANSDVSQYCN